jgi:hypothetical protein
LSALTIGQLSAAQAGAFCCTICSSCTRLAAVRPRRYSPTGLQLEHEQLFGNGLRSDLELSSAEVTTKPDPDGRLVRRLQPRRTWDLSTFATKPQICTYLRLDHVAPALRDEAPGITNGGVVLSDGNGA